MKTFRSLVLYLVSSCDVQRWCKNDVKSWCKNRIQSIKLLVAVGVLACAALLAGVVNAANMPVGSVGFVCHKTEGIRAVFFMSFGWKPYIVTIVDESDSAYKVEFDWINPPGYSKGDSVWIPRNQFSYKNECMNKVG